MEYARRRHVPVGAAAAGAGCATLLLPRAVDKGVAFVPGAPFYAGQPDARCLRLSFVTSTVAQIDAGIAALAAAIREQPASA